MKGYEKLIWKRLVSIKQKKEKKEKKEKKATGLE